jgi:hypothetical protein
VRDREYLFFLPERDFGVLQFVVERRDVCEESLAMGTDARIDGTIRSRKKMSV